MSKWGHALVNLNEYRDLFRIFMLEMLFKSRFLFTGFADEYWVYGNF